MREDPDSLRFSHAALIFIAAALLIGFAFRVGAYWMYTPSTLSSRYEVTDIRPTPVPAQTP